MFLSLNFVHKLKKCSGSLKYVSFFYFYFSQGEFKFWSETKKNVCTLENIQEYQKMFMILNFCSNFMNCSIFRDYEFLSEIEKFPRFRKCSGTLENVLDFKSFGIS
mgnify:CR=1 FL=1